MNPPNQNLLTGSKPQSEGNEPGTLRLRQGKLENLKIKVKVIPHTNAVLPLCLSCRPFRLPLRSSSESRGRGELGTETFRTSRRGHDDGRASRPGVCTES